MFKITKAITLYTFEELSTTAKETAKENYLLASGDWRAEIFAEDCDEDLRCLFPSSNLDVEFSCGCVQSDYFRIRGTMSFEDVLMHITEDFTSKEIRTLTWVFSNWLTGCDMTDFWAANYKTEIIEIMEYNCMRNIPYEAVEEFDRLAQIFMDEVESKYRRDMYAYLLEMDEEEMEEIATANGWLFDASGNLSEYSMADIADADKEKLYLCMDWFRVCTEIGTDEFSKIA